MKREGARAVVGTGSDDMRATFTTPIVKIYVVGVGPCGACVIWGTIMIPFAISRYGFDFAATELEEILTRVGDVPEAICRSVIDDDLVLWSGRSKQGYAAAEK